MNLPDKYVIICKDLKDFYKISDILGIGREYWDDAYVEENLSYKIELNPKSTLRLSYAKGKFQYCVPNYDLGAVNDCKKCGICEDYIFYKSSYFYRKEKLERINL